MLLSSNGSSSLFLETSSKRWKRTRERVCERESHHWTEISHRPARNGKKPRVWNQHIRRMKLKKAYFIWNKYMEDCTIATDCRVRWARAPKPHICIFMSIYHGPCYRLNVSLHDSRTRTDTHTRTRSHTHHPRVCVCVCWSAPPYFLSMIVP